MGGIIYDWNVHPYQISVSIVRRESSRHLEVRNNATRHHGVVFKVDPCETGALVLESTKDLVEKMGSRGGGKSNYGGAIIITNFPKYITVIDSIPKQVIQAIGLNSKLHYYDYCY